MKSRYAPFVLLLSLASLGSFLPGVSGEDESAAPSVEKRLNVMELSYSIEVEEVDKRRRAAVEELNVNYVKALERLVTKVQERADLEGAVAIREEIDTVRSGGEPGGEEYPESQSMRSKYAEARSAIESKRREAVRTIRGRHFAELQALEVELTKAGNLDAALEVNAATKKVKRKVEKIEAAMVDSSEADSPASTASTGSMEPLVEKEVKESPLDGVERFVGDVTLEPGRYSLPGRVTLGNPKLKDEPKDERGGTVEVLPGTEYAKLDLLIDDGRLEAEGTRFLGSTIRIDLGGIFVARGCLFDDCTLRKGGAWTRKHYSAEWTFENCIFFRSFI